jgi:hypothetical protein
MSFDSSSVRKVNSDLLSMSNDITAVETQTQEQNQVFQPPDTLNGMLHNKELLTCYRCKETFDPENEAQHTLDSNNILLGIILNKRTPSSICLKCLSLKMMEVITEQFTKNSKDYQGLFFNYEQKFKS